MKLQQEDQHDFKATLGYLRDFKASLNYTAKLFLKKQNITNEYEVSKPRN